MDEIWHQVEFDGGGYEVSNLGHFRRHERRLKPRPDRYGYLRISLRLHGRRVLPTLHSLVALAFIGPRPTGMEVAHIDGNQTNNAAANLAYVTPRENRRHSREHGTLPRGETHGSAKLSLAQVEEIIGSYIHGDRVNGTNATARRYGVDPATIRRVVKGRNWADARNAARSLGPLLDEEAGR